MALVIANRVREASATIGTGAMSLLGAALGYQSFAAAVGTGNTTYYAIVSGAGQWEIGLGTVVGTELQRTTVLDSSSGGSLVNFAPGTKDVFATLPANIPALVEDLAATGAGKGAEMVAFKQSGVGAVDRTISDELRDRVSVTQFGAVGTALGDQSGAFEKTYDRVVKGTSFVPAGTYLATSIKLKNKYTLEGEGVEASTLKAIGAVTLITSDLTNNSYCGLSRLSVRGDGSDVTPGQKLMDLTGAFASNFNQAFFGYAPDLIQLQNIEGQTVFRDSYFTNASKTDAGYAVRLVNVSDMTIDNSPIENCSNGVYATATTAVTRFKFKNVHSEFVGRLFNIDTGRNLGMVEFSDVVALHVGSNLADPTTGYAIRVNKEMAKITNLQCSVVNANTPVITTPLWSIYARDCPSFQGDDATNALIPSFEIGLHDAYIASAKRSLLDKTLTPASIYTVNGGAVVSVANGYGEFSGAGQYRIRPLTESEIANQAVMIRFEYQSNTASTYTMFIDGMGEAMIGYSGSTVTRSGNKIQLPSTAGVWKRVYMYVRTTAEFAQASRFFYINAANAGDSMKVRKLEIFECSRPPYSLLDW